jgi:asparagine synthase (glutamine-hydrolysing)
MTSTNGDIVLTADARIDNRDELIDSLGLTDCASKEIADSELILAAYEKWGEHCPKQFLGDFAFSLWDRLRHRLFCARDHFGVRSLYYYHKPGKIFAFASEIKALLCLPEVPRRLNELQLGNYLEGIFDDKTSTFYQDILRLPPAYSLTISTRGIKQQCYWLLDPSLELRLGSDEEYAAAYRETFTKAVRCRLRSAFPLASHLSGGLDSSSITCVARDLLAREGDRRLNTYSIIFDEVPESDERPFINAVVDAGGVEPHYIRGDTVTPLTDVDRVLWHQDEPFYGPNLFLNWQVWSAARQQRIRVLLDGIMGDNVVSHGFAYLNELARLWRWRRLTHEVKALARRRNIPHWKIVGRFVWNDGIISQTPVWLRQFVRNLREQPRIDEKLRAVVNLEFARRTELPERILKQNETQNGRSWSAKETHYQELSSGMIPAALEVAANGISAFGIELRFPFLDRRLVEFCYAIPPDQKINDGWTRAVVRRALADSLPSKIRFRSDKGDLGPNFISGLTSEQEQLRELLYDPPDLLAKYIKLDALKVLFQRFIEGAKLSDDDLLMIYQIALLALWLRQQVLTTDGKIGDKCVVIRKGWVYGKQQH